MTRSYRWYAGYCDHSATVWYDAITRDRAEITKAGTTWRTVLIGTDAAHIIHVLEHGSEDAAISALVLAHYRRATA